MTKPAPRPLRALSASALALVLLAGCEDPVASPFPGCAELACFRGVCAHEGAEARCVCELGWAGPRCDTCADGYEALRGGCVTVAPCAESPCLRGDCRLLGGEPTCLCELGWDGPTCARCADGYAYQDGVCELIGPNPCDPNPCNAEFRSQCVALPGGPSGSFGGYRCDCDPKYVERDGTCILE